jgi:uncharacterized protein
MLSTMAAWLPAWLPTWLTCELPHIFPFLGLALAGFLAGAMNSLAGGGGFIVLPALMMTGSSPIHANATGSVAVWPGVFMSLIAYRGHLKTENHSMPLYLGLAIVGSLLGSILLLFTSNPAFLKVLPWLLFGATTLFLLGPRLTDAARHRSLQAQNHTDPSYKHKPKTWFITLLLAIIAIYGGYFGGGMGIMTLATLALLGISDIHELNALKTLLVFTITTVSVLIFIARGAVDWRPVIPMLIGSLAGGYVASRWAVGLSKTLLRRVIAGMCVAITLAYMAHGWGWLN